MAEPVYTSASALREKLEVTAEVLSDDEALNLIETAEDLIDERLGARPIDEDTGRKVVPADEDAWRVEKLAKATLEVAAVIFRDPGVESRQRVRSVSGDVSTSSPYGYAYGERAQALINASGLAYPFARVGRRRSRGEQFRESFDRRLP